MGSMMCHWHLACSPRRTQGPHGFALGDQRGALNTRAAAGGGGGRRRTRSNLSHLILRRLHSARRSSERVGRVVCVWARRGGGARTRASRVRGGMGWGWGVAARSQARRYMDAYARAAAVERSRVIRRGGEGEMETLVSRTSGTRGERARRAPVQLRACRRRFCFWRPWAASWSESSGACRTPEGGRGHAARATVSRGRVRRGLGTYRGCLRTGGGRSRPACHRRRGQAGAGAGAGKGGWRRARGRGGGGGWGGGWSAHGGADGWGRERSRGRSRGREGAGGGLGRTWGGRGGADRTRGGPRSEWMASGERKGRWRKAQSEIAREEEGRGVVAIETSWAEEDKESRRRWRRDKRIFVLAQPI